MYSKCTCKTKTKTISVVICVLSKRIVNIFIYFRILRDEIINEDFPTVMKLVQVM